MFSILSILDQSKNNSFDFDNLLDKFENKKLIEINTKLHKKIINNFHKLKLNDEKEDKLVNRNIIKETIDILNECIIELSLL